jgi:hypothetical protein
MRLKAKAATITGGNSGIGLATDGGAATAPQCAQTCRGELQIDTVEHGFPASYAEERMERPAV